MPNQTVTVEVLRYVQLGEGKDARHFFGGAHAVDKSTAAQLLAAKDENGPMARELKPPTATASASAAATSETPPGRSRTVAGDGSK